jgi:phosphoribosylformylglycinamidine synthase
MIAVSEAAKYCLRGGIPVAITNCLNFGNPTIQVYWQFVNVMGMIVAVENLIHPSPAVTCFYNQSADDGPDFQHRSWNDRNSETYGYAMTLNLEMREI